MQVQVDARWYKLYNWILLGLSIVLFIATMVVKNVHSLSHFANSFDLSTYTAIVALIYILYGSVLFLLVSKKYDFWYASLFCGIVFSLNELNLLARTSLPVGYVYMAIWYLMTLFSGAFGIAVLIEFDFLITVFVYVKNNFELSRIDHEFIILLVSTYVLSFVFYIFIWRNIYKHSRSIESIRLSKLSSMLKDNKDQSEILISSIADGVVVINKDGKITLMNAAAAAMTEWTLQDAIGIDVNLVVKLTTEDNKEVPNETNPFFSAINNKSKQVLNFQLKGRQNKTIIISLVVSPVLLHGDQPGDSVVGAVAVMRDISSQRAAEKQKEDFISTASHEMRTPVAAIEGYLALAMNDRVANIDTKAREFLEKAHTSTQHLGTLFQDLLTSSKAEDGRLSNHPVVVEMGAFTQQLVESLQLAAQKKHLLVDFSSSNDSNHGQSAQTGRVIRPLYYVHVDPDRIREVITNIFDNAVKYTESGKITIGISATPNSVDLFVQDTGPGIPADDIPHLFQKFYRVDNSAIRTIGGTGLGLFICRKIVEMYNGKIWVESVVGKGSTFRISLPRINEQQAESLKASEAVQSQLAMPTATPTL